MDLSKAAVLGRVMQLFWMRGADLATYPEIVVTAGLSRKMLYRLWPEKADLVHDTLRLYRNRVLDQLLQILSSGGASGLAEFWSVLEAASAAPGWCGCFLFRSGTGPLRHDAFVADLLRCYLEDLQSGFAAAITAGQKAGAILAGFRAEDASWQCVALVNLISGVGAQSGYDERIARMFRSARAASGLP